MKERICVCRDPEEDQEAAALAADRAAAALEAAEDLAEDREDLADLVFTADLALVRAMAFTVADAWAAL